MADCQHEPIKVAFLMDFPVPYRERTFEKFVAFDMDLTVFYCARQVPGRDWAISAGSYNQRFLRGWSIGSWFHLNVGIVGELTATNYQALVVYGYHYPTAVLALLTAKVRGIPVVMRSESTLTDHSNMRRGWFMKFIKALFLRPLLQLCNGLAPSGTLASDYLQHYGATAAKCFIVPTACDVDMFMARSAAVREHRTAPFWPPALNRDNVTFIYSGRLIPLKQVDKLITAFSRLRINYKNVTLIIVGDGPERASLETDAAGVPDIHLVGFQAQEALAEYYGLADVFVFPSRGDVWGVVINEAMACGLPVVSNPTVGAVPDMVKDEINGIVTEGSEPDELYRAMERFVLEPALARRMGAKAREMSGAWSHKAAAAGFRAVVNAVVRCN